MLHVLQSLLYQLVFLRAAECVFCGDIEERTFWLEISLQDIGSRQIEGQFIYLHKSTSYNDLFCQIFISATICPEGEKVVVHVSNFRKVKRVPEVVSVFAKILGHGIKAKLLLVGDGPDRLKAEQQCRDLGICSHTRFLGKLDEVVLEYYNTTSLSFIKFTKNVMHKS